MLQKLESLRKIHKNDSCYVKRVNGLYRILLELMIPSDLENNTFNGIISFNEAYELYSSYYPNNVDKVQCRDNLLHPEWGLPVHLVTLPDTKTFVVLKSPNLDISLLVKYLLPQKDPEQLLLTDMERVSSIVGCMDSEWDKTCARLLFSLGKSRKVVESCNLDPDIININKDKIFQIAEEVKNTVQVGTDIVNQRLSGKKEKLLGAIAELEKTSEKHKDNWSQARLQEIEEEKISLQERLESTVNVLNHSDATNKRKFHQMVKRTANNLCEENRVKRRKLGAGAPVKLDSDDEEFIARCIEQKATYHGRRHNTVMYTNRRVKSRDLLNIANHNLRSRGKKRIRSATTVWNRSAPRNKRSRQARLHMGRGLFCTKKPPKAEDRYNLNTHHQRAHCKNVQLYLFNDPVEAKFAYIDSEDDKAYVRPGTSEGFEKTRNIRILSTSDANARQLPKYDWPEKQMYQTPGAHRIIEKEVLTIEGEKTLSKTSDRHYVIVRPKAYVDSSGTTWASEHIWLRQEDPDTFEVPGSGQKVNARLRSYVSKIHDSVFQYNDMTMDEDLKKVTTNLSCNHREYELRRLQILQERLEGADNLKDNIGK